jgi:hypothetical protein
MQTSCHDFLGMIGMQETIDTAASSCAPPLEPCTSYPEFMAYSQEVTEDRVAELETQLQATAQARDAAIAAQTAAERERDQAVQDLEEIEGTFGEEDLREYCEVCNHHWHREYVTWFAHPFETEDGRHVNSACGGCFRQVPVGHGPVV